MSSGMWDEFGTSPMQVFIDEMGRRMKNARVSQMMTLGKALGVLEEIPDPQYIECFINIKGKKFQGTTVCSYRGYYEDLALVVEEVEIPTTSVDDMLGTLYGAMGRKFEGYKGGEYLMGEDTPLWVTFDSSGTGFPIDRIEIPSEHSVVVHVGNSQDIEYGI